MHTPVGHDRARLEVPLLVGAQVEPVERKGLKAVHHILVSSAETQALSTAVSTAVWVQATPPHLVVSAGDVRQELRLQLQVLAALDMPQPEL